MESVAQCRSEDASVAWNRREASIQAHYLSSYETETSLITLLVFFLLSVLGHLHRSRNTPTNISIGGADDHTDKERDPPARPTQLEFPNYVPTHLSDTLTPARSSQVRDRICHVRSFAEISDDDLKLLNIHYQNGVDLDQILPQDQFRDRPLLFDEDLEAMLTEISVDNQDAFREILRMEPLPGRPKPRIAYARNFFGSLEDMARYWDTSSDEYYKIPDTGSAPAVLNQAVNGNSGPTQPTANLPAGRNTDVEMTDVEASGQESKSTIGSSQKMKEVYKGYRFGNGEQVNPGTRVALVKNLLKMVVHKFTCRDHEPMPAPREKFIIRGVKVQSIQYQFCIARIPRDSKLARGRMVEGPLMAVSCREEVRFASNVKRPSAQELLAGQPLERTGVPSNQATPKPTAQPSNFVGEKFDLFREIGCMLILASQRRREGKSKDSFAGADKWWVSKERWGGGPLKWGQLASEVYEDEDPSWSPAERRLQEEKRQREEDQKSKAKELKPETISIDDLMANNAPTLPRVPGEPLQEPRKKKLRSLDRPPGKEDEIKDGRRLMYVPPFRKKWYQDWQKLKANTPLWDDKIIYKHIGKTPDSQFDDIYMVTSVNHHVALIRMRVSSEYLEWIESGQEVADEGAVDPNMKKNVLHIERSTWYDMFDVAARSKFLIALWRLMCWLNREHVDPAEFEKMEAKRRAHQEQK